MFSFIKIQFELGRITPEKVHSYAPRFITMEQAEQIIYNGGNNNAVQN